MNTSKSFWQSVKVIFKSLWGTCIKRKGEIGASFLISVVSFAFVLLVFNELPDLFSSANNKKHIPEEVYAWFYFVTGVGTAALAIIAWVKLGDFNQQNKNIYKKDQANFLLRIDERWGSPEVINARTIIHVLYRTVQEKHAEPLLLKKVVKEREKFIQEKIGDEIIELSKNTSRSHDFLHLLNFLDFMETIGYLEAMRHVSSKQLDALCGEALIFNYNIFQPYILQKRKKHDNDRFYKNFDKLYKKLPRNVEPETS